MLRRIKGDFLALEVFFILFHFILFYILSFVYCGVYVLLSDAIRLSLTLDFSSSSPSVFLHPRYPAYAQRCSFWDSYNRGRYFWWFFAYKTINSTIIHLSYANRESRPQHMPHVWLSKMWQTNLHVVFLLPTFSWTWYDILKRNSTITSIIPLLNVPPAEKEMNRKWGCLV